MSSDTSSEFDPLNPREDEDGWEDQDDDQEHLQVVSLFDEEIFSDLKSMIAACKVKHGFDFIETQRKLGVFALTHNSSSIPKYLLQFTLSSVQIPKLVN